MTCARGCCDTQAEHYRSIAFDRHSVRAIDRSKDKELALYQQARKEGSQPWGTKTVQSHHAMNESDRLGRPFNAANLGMTYYPEHAKALKPLTDAQKERARGASSS